MPASLYRQNTFGVYPVIINDRSHTVNTRQDGRTHDHNIFDSPRRGRGKPLPPRPGALERKITERGKKQIDALAERFKDVHIDAVYSSDLDRARDTAGALLRGRDLELHTTRQLREIHMGVWEGDSWGNLSYQWPTQMYNFNNDPDNWCVPGCESFEQCRVRMTRAIEEIAREHDGQTVGIVAHGMCIKIFLMGVMGIRNDDPEAMMHGDNTSVSLLHYADGKFAVEYYNDNSHLGQLSTFARQQCGGTRRRTIPPACASRRSTRGTRPAPPSTYSATATPGWWRTARTPAS